MRGTHLASGPSMGTRRAFIMGMLGVALVRHRKGATMGRLIFSAAEVKPILDHTLTAPAQRKAWGREPFTEPQVCLVHDEGVYLMSNGEPRQLDPRRGATRHDGRDFRPYTYGEGFSLVAYALGCDPRTGDVWDHCRELVGGDDFSEYLPAAWFTAPCNTPHALIEIEMRERDLSFRWSVPGAPKPRRPRKGVTA